MKETKASPMKTTNLSYVTDKRYQVALSSDIELRWSMSIAFVDDYPTSIWPQLKIVYIMYKIINR